MLYSTERLSLISLLNECAEASAVISRLDERISRSPIKDGIISRLDFHDAAASMWVDGELVHLEDLVLHDAKADIRTPTHEVTSAHRILRNRRLIFSNTKEWALSQQGLNRLLGKRVADELVERPIETVPDTTKIVANDFDLALTEIHCLLNRTNNFISAIEQSNQFKPFNVDAYSVPASDKDEENRLSEWIKVYERCAELPAVLQAAILLDAWNVLEVSQRSSWLGRLLCAALLRQRDLTTSHLYCINTGLKTTQRDKRQSKSQQTRINAILNSIVLGSELCLKEHEKLIQAKHKMERRVIGRRSNSRLPELIDLVIKNPVVTTAMIVKELGTTPQGAVGLANQLELRELTGRGRFRAWGVL